jgi:hypothetical protein
MSLIDDLDLSIGEYKDVNSLAKELSEIAGIPVCMWYDPALSEDPWTVEIDDTAWAGSTCEEALMFAIKTFS